MHRTQAILKFLQVKTQKDLAELYSYEMECQVNVSQDGGERIDGEFKGRKWHGWTDGLQTWKSFRIPYNANTEPHYEDKEIKFDLEIHAEGIGMTGWDWKQRISKWVAYDFDAMIGHSNKHSSKLSNIEMQEVEKIASEIPWVTVRKSTSGKGLHLYVFVNDVETKNHNEHAALARAILGKMSSITGFDFSNKVDICGGNMWIWHRKMKGTEGLNLIKQGSILSDIPQNWKDHIKVITGRRRRILPKFINPDKNNEEKLFEELTGQRPGIELDEEHLKLIKFLEEKKTQTWWSSDHQMLVTHTFHLKEAHEELQCKGIFDTLSKGTEYGRDHNCFDGQTEILTEDGPRTFSEIVNEKVKLYVRTPEGMRWIMSEIKCFGEQITVSIQFGNHYRFRATLYHEWYYGNTKQQCKYDKTKFTFELNENNDKLPLAPFTLPKYDEEGYAHGFVFGDGWITNKKAKKITIQVALYKNDNDLLKLLCKFGNYGSEKRNGSYVNAVRSLPAHWKELPHNPTKSYALGFILGLISADGYVVNNVQIYQTDYDDIFEIRKLALYAGLRTSKIQFIFPRENAYSNKVSHALNISTYNIPVKYFIRKDQQKKFKKAKKYKSTSITNIDYTDTKKEKVYCAIVPRYHNFTLANGVITRNCFMFPLRKGAWSVRRYSLGVQESDSWEQDTAGYTKCYFNKEPDLNIASRANEGIEHPSSGYVFRHADFAVKTGLALGVDFNLPNWIMGRKTKLKSHKDGRLIVEIDKEDTDLADEMKGWLPEKGSWKRIFNAKINTGNEMDVGNFDDILRHLVAEEKNCGWVIKANNLWHEEPLTHVKPLLESEGVTPKEATIIVGQAIAQPWKLVNIPFQNEYPGSRCWNRNAAQLKYVPSQNKDDLSYPTWLKILKHCGSGLDDAIENNPWAKVNGILNGADYLKCWIASIFQEPLEPLPYLFLYGPQNSGKSILHEALGTLLTRGSVRADNALISQAGFNGELENSIICIVEETDLRKHRVAYNRIKDWVTSKDLPIHRKQKTPYSIPNSTHWIQCANDYRACPIFPGDTRITMSFVNAIDPIDLIPKKQIMPMLEKEAPDFLAELLNLELPQSNDRLNVPVIVTEDKIATERTNQTMLEMFIDDKCHNVTGEMIKFSEVYERFQEWLDPNEVHNWSKVRFGREIPPQFPKGRLPQTGEHWLGNISWEAKKSENTKLMIKDGKLVYGKIEERA